MNKMLDCSGKVVVVTGGAGRIGKHLAQAFALAGAEVVVADIDEKAAAAVSDLLQQQGHRAMSLLLDIADESSIVQCIALLKARFQAIDVWVNNAYPRTADWGVKLEDIPAESWRKNVDMHLIGYCLCCQKVAEHMKVLGTGSIINISSIYGIIAPDFSVYEGTAMTSAAPYAAIKGGIVQFTRYLASYYGPSGVRVNSVSPGGVFDNQPGSFVKAYISKTPLRRMATVGDVAGAVLFLGSEASAYITGHNLVVDGGYSIQ
ncbi:MAG: SDR family oxidoreductase [Candidatus Omnitrophica bacterium]|nr:SDR family oxidoreductase [Candidatus Omnitrophota bacterium]